MKDGKNRSDIQIGQVVSIVQKHHQRSGETTIGEVSKILTKSPTHPHGIKVQLTTREVGRIVEIMDWD